VEHQGAPQLQELQHPRQRSLKFFQKFLSLELPELPELLELLELLELPELLELQRPC